MAEKPDFDKIFANKATSVHEWDKDNYDTGWGFLGETPPPYELFDSLQRENDTKTKYLYERAEEINTDLTQDINNLQSDLNSKYNELKTGLGGANTALQQHNTDENAHSNLFQRALVTEAKTAPNTADWNTLTESRTYKISGATFAADKHQPVGAVGTGELVVLKNGDDTIAQVYYANSAAYDRAGAYHRMCINGTWTDWVYNITNKGGNITGDFNINGKLTVDSLDIKNNFTVAGGTPVTGDDLQKVQDQIIAPTQIIYISPSGSNETGDGSSQKPYKTMDYAITKINKQVPTITFNLDCREQSNSFSTTGIDLFRQTQIKRFNVQAWQNLQGKRYKANLTVEYSKMQCTDDWTSTGDPTRYFWGNILINTTTFSNNNNVEVYLNNLNISLGTRYKSDNEAKFLCICDTLIMDAITVNIDDYSLWKPAAGNGKEANITLAEGENIFKYVALKTTKSASSDPNVGGDITNLRSDSRDFTISFLTGSRIPETVINNNGGVSPEIPSGSILYKRLIKP